MSGTSDPKLGAFGDSFAKPYGDLVDTTKPKGEIITSALNVTLIGDDVEFSHFEEEIDSFIRGRLGEPIIRVELTRYQIKTCIDEAVTKVAYHAPDWSRQLMTFQTTPGVNIYELPPHVIQSVRYITYKKNLIGIPGMGNTIEQDYFLKYFQSNFLFNDFSLGEYYLLQASLKQMRKVLGQDGTWEILNNRYLSLTPVPSFGETVIVEYNALDSGTIHPAYKNFIQRYALAVAKGVLGQVRSKYSMLPGPSGATKLNGELLLRQSEDELEKLEKQLMQEFDIIFPSFTFY